LRETVRASLPRPAHAIIALEVKATATRRFARLGPLRAPTVSARHVALQREAAKKAAIAQQNNMDGRLPRRRDAVTPKGPKRSVGAAKLLDGGSAAWPSRHLSARIRRLFAPPQRARNACVSILAPGSR
jgi:hypothetical protein